MPSEIIDRNTASLQDTVLKLPAGLPHGLIVPSREVRDYIASLDEKLLKEHGFTINGEARLRELNRHTLNGHFDDLGYEVAYRETPQGPEVMAVGDEEIVALTRDMSLEEQLKIRRWLP